MMNAGYVTNITILYIGCLTEVRIAEQYNTLTDTDYLYCFINLFSSRVIQHIIFLLQKHFSSFVSNSSIINLNK
jgi:hypothetical protein